MTRALLVIDVQQDWATPNTDFHIEGVEDIVAEINELIDAVREDGDKIIFTQHVELDDAGNPHPGAAFLPDLHRMPGDVVLQKTTVSPFFDGKLDDQLEDVDELIICGLGTNLAVRQTVEEAYDRDYDITVIDSACASPSEYAHVFTLKDLELTRDQIDVVDLEDYLDVDSDDDEEDDDSDDDQQESQPPQTSVTPQPMQPQPVSQPVAQPTLGSQQVQ